MRRKSIVGILLLGAVIGGVFVLFSRDYPQTDTEVALDTFTDERTGASFQYPRGSLDLQPLSTEDNNQEIIFRATENGQQAPFLVTLRYETGLRVAANLAKTKTIDLVLDGASKSLPNRFPAKYHKLSERQFDQDGREAAEIIFEYEGPAGKKIRQRLLLLAKDNDSAFYLAGQTQASDYKAINDTHFDSLFASLRLSSPKNKD